MPINNPANLMYETYAKPVAAIYQTLQTSSNQAKLGEISRGDIRDPLVVLTGVQGGFLVYGSGRGFG